MDKKELEAFKNRSNELLEALDKIKQKAISHVESAKTYSAAAEKVETLIEANNQFIDQTRNVIKKIEDYIAGLYDLGSEKAIEEITKFNNSIKLLKDDIDAVTKIMDEIKVAEKEMRGVIGEIEKLWSAISSLEETMKLLTKTLEEQQAMSEKILPALDEMNKKLEKTESVLIEVRSENQKLREENISLREAITKILEKFEEESKKKSKLAPWKKRIK